jgi:hypothetical protein
MFAAAIAAKYMLAIEALTDLRVAASVPLQMGAICVLAYCLLAKDCQEKIGVHTPP